MTMALALVEGGLLFSVASSAIFISARALVLDWSDVAVMLVQALVFGLCCIVAFYYNDLYDLRIVRGLPDFASRLLQSIGVAFILLAVTYVLFPDTKIGRGPFLSSLIAVVTLLLLIRTVSYALMRSRPFAERVLVLGSGALARTLVAQIESQPHLRYAVVGVVEDTVVADDGPCPHAVAAALAQVGAIIHDLEPDRVIVALTERRGRLPLRPLVEARMQGVLFEDGIELYERLTGKIAIESLTPGSLIFSKDFRKSRLDLALGRAVSLVAAVLGLVGLAPLMALIAVAIKLDSRGPVLFAHDRVGVNGRRFTLLKFRTMHPVAVGTSEWVRDNSDRITRVGTWLRKFRLDELPQFVNIVRGDMNLVGPRPHPVSNFELFSEQIPYYSVRGGVRPGITGWAQVRYGYANSLPEETEKMRYDLYYIKHLSLWFDLRILFDTVKIVLFGRGSRAADAQPISLAAAAVSPRAGH